MSALAPETSVFATGLPSADVSGGNFDLDPGEALIVKVPDVPAAGSAAGRIVAVRQRYVLATAFHPELTGDWRVHQLFGEMVRQRGVESQCAGARMNAFG
jgi:protein involved in polysaccharide export with SLBB domain